MFSRFQLVRSVVGIARLHWRARLLAGLGVALLSSFMALGCSGNGGSPTGSGGHPAATGGNVGATGGNVGATGGNVGATGGNMGGAGGNAEHVCAVGEAAIRPIKFFIALPAGMAPTLIAPFSTRFFDVVGTTTAVDHVDAPATGGQASVRITVTDGDGQAWGVLVAAESVLDQWEAAARETMGSQVTLRLRYRRGFQQDNNVGFVLHDERGLVMASEGGPFVIALAPEDIPSVTVSKGAVICREAPGLCVTRTFRMLSLAGTTNAEVSLDRDAELTIGTRPYRARNLGVHDFIQTGCVDNEEGSPWALWRLTAAGP